MEIGETQTLLQQSTYLLYGRVARLKPFLWSDEPQFQACMEETRHCTSPAQYHLNSKVCGRSIMLWGCFSAAETRGLVGVEGKLNAANIEIALMKTLSGAFKTSDRPGEG